MQARRALPEIWRFELVTTEDAGRVKTLSRTAKLTPSLKYTEGLSLGFQVSDESGSNATSEPAAPRTRHGRVLA